MYLHVKNTKLTPPLYLFFFKSIHFSHLQIVDNVFWYVSNNPDNEMSISQSGNILFNSDCFTGLNNGLEKDVCVCVSSYI